jgi:hypothetical protein
VADVADHRFTPAMPYLRYKIRDGKWLQKASPEIQMFYKQQSPKKGFKKPPIF